MLQHGGQQAFDHGRRQVVAHAGNADQAGAVDAPGGVFTAGVGHQRVGQAVQHQGGRLHAGQRLGAAGVGGDGHHLAHGALRRIRTAVQPGADALAYQVLFHGEIGAANGAQQAHIVAQHGFAVTAFGAGHHHAQHLGLGAGKAAGAAAAHDAGQAQCALGGRDGHVLGNHAAHRRPDDVGALYAQGVQHAEGVLRHVVQGVGRLGGQAHAELDRFPEQIGRAQVVEFLGQADVAVVMPDDPVTLLHQRLHQLYGPGHQLHAQPHDEHYHFAAAPSVFHFDLELVCFDFHSCMRR